MKKHFLFFLVLFSSIAYGQVPNQINYQGIARNSVGNVLPNKNISVRLSIHDGSNTGLIVYQELRHITTSNFGLFNIAIGSSGATTVTGTIAAVNWGAGAKFLQVEIDPMGGSSFIDLGAAQLLSVPYALFSGNAINSSPGGAAGGDLSGSYPNPSITDGAVTSNKLGDNSVTTSKIDDGSVTAAKLAVGVIPTSLPPNGTAGGDLSGTYPNPTIGINAITTSKILDGSVTAAKLAAGVIPTSLPPNGVAGGDLSGSYPNPTIGINAITTSKILDGSVTAAKLAAGVIPTSLPPIGTAGGDLSGTYPNPIIGNNVITTAKILNGSVTLAKLAPGVIPASLPPSGGAGGDLSGTYPNPSVNKLVGVSINGTAPVTGQVLKFNGTQWAPGTDNSVPSGAAGGDLSGSYPNPTIANNTITTNKILNGSVTAAKLAAGVIPTSLPPNGTAGGDLSGTYPNPTIGINAITTSKILDGSVTAAKLAAGVIPSSLPPNGAAGGDLSGTYPNPTIGINAITTTKILDGSVTAAKLAAGTIPTSLPPTGTAGGDLTGTYPNPTIGVNAITTSKILDGSVTLSKLAAGVIPTSLPPNGAAGGDLAGTYPNPTVNQIQGVSVDNTAPAIGQVLKFDGIQWSPGTDNSGSGGSPTGSAGGDLSGTYPNPNIASGAITTPKIANGSIVTPKIVDGAVTAAKLAAGVIPTSLPPNGAAGGDLSGTYPNPTIGINAITTSKILDGSVTLAKLAAGVIPTSLPPTGTAGGDLAGTYPNPTVDQLQGVSVNNAAPAIGQVLKFDGTKWSPGTDNSGSGSPTGAAGGDLSGTYPNPTIGINAITTSKILDGSVTLAKLAAGVIPTSLPPSGTAGGDLSGTYPNPTVAANAITTTKLADNSVTTSKIVDASVTAAKLAVGVIPTSLPPNGAAGGDLSGTYPNPTIGINAITTSKILDGSVTLAKLAAGVIPTSLPPNGTAGGDLAGTYPNPTVNQIQGVSVNNATPTIGQVLKFDGTKWSPGTDDSGSGSPTGAAGGDLSGTYPNPTIGINAITTSKILDGSVTAAKLAAGVIPTSLPPNGSAGGDLSGTYPNPTVAANAITTTKLADNAITTLKIADASVTAAKLAAGLIPTSLPPNGTAGGDLSGTYPNPTVAANAITTTKLADNAVTTLKIADASVTAAKLAAGLIPTSLPPNGAAGGDLSGTYPNPTIGINAITTTKILDGSVTAAKLAAGIIPASLPPNGSAGGDLSGTYPNPTVAANAITTTKLADNAVTTLKIADASVTAAKLAAGIIPTSLPPNGSAGGDLSGSYPNPTVNKIQGTSVIGTAPVSGQVLKFNGSQWAPGTDNTGAFALPYSNSLSSVQNLISLTNSGTGAGLEGINSSANANAYGVVGRISSTSPGISSAGIVGINNGTGSNGVGVWGSHSGFGIGVYGTSASNNGVWGYSADGNGVFGSSDNYNAGYFDISNASNSADAIAAFTVGTGPAVYGSSDQSYGVWGITYSGFASGIYGLNGGGGEAITGITAGANVAAVVGKNAGDNGIGVSAMANAGGTTNGTALLASLESAGGDLAVFQVGGSNVARINDNGKGFFNGGTQNSGADVAEAFDIEGARKDYEPGDVLVISQNSDRKVEKSSQPYSTLVAGVYAAKPGLLLTEKNAEQDQLDKMVPMGVVGVIATKVCLEGGAIKRGDLLVTSSTPGVAMKADPDKVKVGQVIGKALQEYNQASVGKINVLVSIK